MGIQKRYLIIGCLIILIGIFIFIGQLPSKQTQIQSESSVSASASTDPGNPITLLNDTSEYDFYASASDYYYRTGVVTPEKYSVCWIRPTDPSDRFEIYLYSDSGYTDIVAGTFFAPTWVIVRPGWLAQRFYPQVHTYAGGGGFGYIEWEECTTHLTSGVPVNGSLDEMEEYIEVYSLDLIESRTYTFDLTVPATGDFDFYLYHVLVGEASSGEGVYLAKTTAGYGVGEVWERETIVTTGEFVLLVVCRNGSGDFTFTFTDHTPETQIPLPTLYVFLGLVIALGISRKIKKDRKFNWT